MSRSKSDAESPHKTVVQPGGLFHRPVRPLKPLQQQVLEVPDRYVLKEDDQGRYLSCLEAPEIRVRVDRAIAVTAGAARKAAEGTIFLDGAAQGEPFLDLERRVYNLDHHEGCVRQFTLSTCEQALVLVMRGLDLREKPWELQANQPDLDTILAIWVLVNSVHLQDKDSPIRETVFPLVRLEGLIDSHGLELAELTGYPEVLRARLTSDLDHLRETELQLKEDDQWDSVDVLDYVRAQLHLVDRLIYPADFFEAFRGIEELAKSELTENRIAVACRSDCGIYELEKELKRLYGKRLGIVVLEKRPGTYTLRQVDPFLPVNLEAAYRKLNVLDPAVDVGGSGNRWGGSGEIGGSPRKTGTALSPVDIVEALRLTYRRPGVVERLLSVTAAVGLSALPMLAGWVAATWGRLGTAPLSRLFATRRDEFLAVSAAVALGCLLAAGRRRRRRLFGLRLPEGRRWPLLGPAVMLMGLAGGAWVFPLVSGRPVLLRELSSHQILLLLGFPLLAEIVFRGIAHGVMVHNFSIQHSQGRWFISWPVAVSSLLFAFWTFPFWPLMVPMLLWPGLAMYLTPLGALFCGLALGLARERSGSLLASLVLHYLAILCALVVVAFFA